MAEKKAALLIASFEYDDPYFRPLKAPAQDVKALSRVLTDPAIGGFCDVKTLLNEPKDALLLAIEEFFDERNKDDLLLLYFSGHGIKDEDGRLYYATKNSRHTRLVSTAVPAYAVNDLIGKSRSRRKILILDCCYSGAFSRAFLAKGAAAVDVLEQFKQGQGLVTLTASDAFQYSFEGEELGNAGACSVFTRALVDGIETGKADRDGDQLISLDELYDYVYECVHTENPQQNPRIQVEVEGKIIVARNPQPPRPAQLPPELEDAIESPFVGNREYAVRELDKLLRGRNKALALTAYEALITLRDDDSRKVANAAETCLRREQERIALEHAEAERLTREKAGQESLKRERAEQERQALEQVEAERQAAEAERAPQERAEKERLEREKEAAARAEADRITREKAEQERLELERVEQERHALEKSEAERKAAEAERAFREKAEKERLERVAQEAAARAEEGRIAREKAEREKLERERKEQEQLLQKAEAERQVAERAESEQAGRRKTEQKTCADWYEEQALIAAETTEGGQKPVAPSSLPGPCEAVHARDAERAGGPAGAKQTVRRSRKRWIAAGAVATLTLAAALSVYVLTPRPGIPHGVVQFWSFANRQFLGEPLKFDSPDAPRIAFSPNGKLVTVDDNSLQLWDAGSRQPIGRDFSQGAGRSITYTSVGNVAFNRDGTFLALPMLDGGAVVWNLASRQALRLPHEGCTRVAFSPLLGWLLATQSSVDIRLWNISTHEPFREPLKSDTHRRSIAFRPVGTTLASGGRSGIWLWDVLFLGNSVGDHFSTESVDFMAFSPDGTKLASVIRGERVWVFDMASRQHFEVYRDPSVLSSSLVPMAAGFGSLSLSKVALQAEPSRKGVSSDIAFSPDGKMLAFATYSSVCLWDGGQVQEIPLRGAWVEHVAFAPDGTTLALAGKDLPPWKSKF